MREWFIMIYYEGLYFVDFLFLNCLDLLFIFIYVHFFLFYEYQKVVVEVSRIINVFYRVILWTASEIIIIQIVLRYFDLCVYMNGMDCLKIQQRTYIKVYFHIFYYIWYHYFIIIHFVQYLTSYCAINIFQLTVH